MMTLSGRMAAFLFVDGAAGVAVARVMAARGVRIGMLLLEEDTKAGDTSPEVLADADLIVDPARLGVTRDDPRLFLAAAALAGVDASECVLLTSHATSAAAAAIAGMRVVGPAAVWDDERSAAGDASAIRQRLRLLDADTRPSNAPRPVFGLRGRVVTMNDRGDVLADAVVFVRDGKIEEIVRTGDPIPERLRDVKVINTRGTIYPGLLDLHSHFAYNVLPLWHVDQPYANRLQWRKSTHYRSEITGPLGLLAAHEATARAIVRYVEVKALVGGTTTGQGMMTKLSGGYSLFHGVMRNVEQPEDGLPRAGTRVPDLDANDPKDVAKFRLAIGRGIYFYHLGEGVDDYAQRCFADLERHNLVNRNLVGIHSLGLRPQDLRAVADAGGRVVWSPYSNLLLYGRTMDLRAILDSGVTWSLGTDWSPTGGRNLLMELKVARWESARQGGLVSEEELVRAVTANAARVVGWHPRAGVLRVGAVADLVVVAGTTGNAYAHLIDATERSIELVAVEGLARYGVADLIRELHPGSTSTLERYAVAGEDRLLYLQSPVSPINELTLAAAEKTLRDAMGDLHGFAEEATREDSRRFSLGVTEPAFRLLLDQEWPDEAGEEGFREGMRRDFAGVVLPERIDLDPLVTVRSEYTARLEGQANLPAALKQTLPGFYD